MNDDSEKSRLRKKLVLELITPAFSGQSTYDGPPEGFSGRCLKPLLRFWWRTVHPDRYEDLLKKDASLFGSAGEEGQRISVRPKASNFALDHAYLVPLSDMGNVTTEMMYLCYGVIDRVKDGKGRPFLVNTAPMYFSGREFEFTITFPEDAGPELETALWLFSVFGGWGRRSRRSFGSLRVVDYFETYPNLTAENQADAHEILRRGLELAYPNKNDPAADSLEHTACSSSMRVLAAPRLYRSAMEAQQALGEGFYRFRRSLGAYRSVNGLRWAIQGCIEARPGLDHNRRSDLSTLTVSPTSVEPLVAQQFGLPLNARMSSGAHVDFECSSGRRASPLFLSVVGFGAEKLLPIISYMPSRFLLKHDDVKVARYHKAGSIVTGVWDHSGISNGADKAINDYLDSLEGGSTSTIPGFPTGNWKRIR